MIHKSVCVQPALSPSYWLDESIRIVLRRCYTSVLKITLYIALPEYTGHKFCRENAVEPQCVDVTWCTSHLRSTDFGWTNTYALYRVCCTYAVLNWAPERNVPCTMLVEHGASTDCVKQTSQHPTARQLDMGGLWYIVKSSIQLHILLGAWICFLNT